MPELPDVLAYVDALRERVLDQPLVRALVRSPHLLRTADPPLRDAVGKRARAVDRIGKRIVLHLEDDLHLVLHLMIAGRLHWRKPGALPAGKIDQAVLGFPHGTLLLTEASTHKRTELHVVRGEPDLAPFWRGGIDVLSCDLAGFRAALSRENHTLKRTLTDPRVFDGIGNAYSDEILHAARLSPLTWTTRLTDEESARLFEAARGTLTAWIGRLAAERAGEFPEKVTAFRKEMAVHGKFGTPCPVCATPVQRIRYADNETDYCPRCQTDGKVLADRSLSRLLKDDWPATIEELEALADKQRARREATAAGPAGGALAPSDAPASRSGSARRRSR